MNWLQSTPELFWGHFVTRHDAALIAPVSNCDRCFCCLVFYCCSACTHYIHWKSIRSMQKHRSTAEHPDSRVEYSCSIDLHPLKMLFILRHSFPLSTSCLQASVSSWAVWSTLTAGTATRCGECAASKRTNTAWALAQCAGLTSWPSWASWTPSSCPSWPSSWGTDRTGSWQRSCWLKARVRT